LGLQAARREIVRLALKNLDVIGCQALGNEMADSFTILREDLVEPFPGALEALYAFRCAGARLGLLTNGSAEFQRKKIERFNLPALFEVILIESEFGIGKPDPRVFQQALSVLGVGPADAWMVGNDLTYDIQPALALGLTAVWVDIAKTGLPPGCSIIPTRTIHSLAELVDGCGP
jgi:putative hydrolase of the HAD superfamily